MQLEFRAVQRIDIFCTGSYNQRQTSEFISACNCSIRHEHQREGGNGIPLVLVPFSITIYLEPDMVASHIPFQLVPKLQ